MRYEGGSTEGLAVFVRRGLLRIVRHNVTRLGASRQVRFRRCRFPYRRVAQFSNVE
jgi:hypothetical protein